MMGAAITTTALILYLAETGVSPLGLAGVLVARSLPQVLGPLAGALADRVDARRLMILCDLGQAATVGAIALFLPPYPLLVALVAASSILSALFLPAGKGAIPRLVAREDLTAANTLMGASFNLSIAAGPALATLLVAGLGARAAFALDAATFVLSAALISRLPSSALRPDASPAADRVRSSVALGLFLSVAFAALDDVALLFLVTDSLGSDRLFVGAATTA